MLAGTGETGKMAQSRVLVFIVAYNAEKTIANVVSRIPATLLDSYEVDVLIIDDSSTDATFAKSRLVSLDESQPFRVTALVNPVNQGYGGNQKIGYRYAIENGYDFVALIHGDGQYAPELIPQLLEPLRQGQAAAVFGSRMLNPRDALRGGMPRYKFVGNKILTWIENKLLRSSLSEFHSGYRLYATSALSAIPFERNSNDFHFDTEIIIQLLIARLPIRELPIPTFYGDEVCHVNGMQYGINVIVAALHARLQESGLFYDPKFDCAPAGSTSDPPKLSYRSPQLLAFDRIKPGACVLDTGCAGGYLGAQLAEQKSCSVDAIDSCSSDEPSLHAFYLRDLNDGLPNLDYERYDTVVTLDVIEHLAKPELFLDRLRVALKSNITAEVYVSTANVAFFITRFMLMAGQFNYGKRGILDLTHTRLFTFRSFERMVRQAGFDILERAGVPGPFPLALGDNRFSRFLLRLNQFLIPLSRGLFSYQIFLRIKPRQSLDYLLRSAQDYSQKRARQIDVPIQSVEHETKVLNR